MNVTTRIQTTKSKNPKAARRKGRNAVVIRRGDEGHTITFGPNTVDIGHLNKAELGELGSSLSKQVLKLR